MPRAVYTTKTEYVYQAMREKIVSGEWPQGMNIVIGKVAADFDISAIPVREALRRLDSEGLVQIAAHKGTQVASLDPARVDEVYAIRSVLEAYAAATALPFVDAGIMVTLRNAVTEMDALANDGNSERFGEANKEFHRSIYKLSPYPMLYDMIFNLWDGGNWSRSVFAFYPERMHRSNAEHKTMLDAIENDEPGRLETLVRSHKTDTALLLRSIAMKNAAADRQLPKPAVANG